MHDILRKIVDYKIKEIKNRKSLCPVGVLEKSPIFNREAVSFKESLLALNQVGIIAEIKRKSPSKGVINDNVSVEELASGYMQAGASALSVLTDMEFFGGSSEDLSCAREVSFGPILRKDFIIDEYQIVEARSIGADVILLIAAALEPDQLSSLSSTAKNLGLEVLVEIHSREELDFALLETVDVIGVNNRNLSDFSVNIEQSFELSEHIPAWYVKISESGIAQAKDIIRLKKIGFDGFLIGETFMKSLNPVEACKKLISEVVLWED